jgi:hypothetical protein
MVMLDHNFPLIREWGWKSDEYGAIINEEFLSLCHWNYVSKRKVDKRRLAPSSGTWMSLSYIYSSNSFKTDTTAQMFGEPVYVHSVKCTRAHTHTQRDAKRRTCYSSTTGVLSPCVNTCAL